MAKSKYFKSKEEFMEVISALFTELQRNDVGKNAAKSGLVIKFIYTNPDCAVTLNSRDKPAEEGVYGTFAWEDKATKPDVTFTGTADYGLRFWQGKENPVISIALGKLKAQGNIAAALALLPIIKPAYKIFPRILKDMGRENLIVK